ncbi:MAG: type II toxin-antitoxin system RelB/DinJ family antitoxin [Olsenella sp.]|jgi:DNA-damage-inducible protein J|nr:type II toxin-antitoxin system RelB/DinJ family antitoxin [Olsenella sp.]
MASRTAEVKSYVEPQIKSEASEVYARWGMSLSDAVNTFLIKSIEVGGLPFDMRPEPRPVYKASTVLPANPAYGSSVLPDDMGNEEDGIYDRLVD